MDLSRDEDSSGGYRGGGDCLDGVNIPLLISGIVVILLGLVDMIVLFVIPTVITNNNKKNLPNSKFEKPNKAIISFHFLEHIFLIALGIILLLMSFCDFSTNVMIWAPVSAGILFLICYIVLIVLGSKTRTYNSQMTKEEMTLKLSDKNPIQFIFFYKEGDEYDENCHIDSEGFRRCTDNHKTCYSEKGFRYNVQSELLSEPYNFSSNVPDLFYFNLKQNIAKNEAQSCINQIENRIMRCDDGYNDVRNEKSVRENYPLPEGNYIISGKKIPSQMTKTSRICSIIFGVTAFYELYTKSIPIIEHTMDVSIKPASSSCNLDDICSNIGYCRSTHRKPTP